ncbi:hypothetical protein [Nocardioides campestrisoli]|uniref:hypothetical protein n=1 Tax=Nocardioides campestrisoli TaxID=2736757 RepID=UPI0015E73055|nr:hypothetical protein [Nocardioides campestrisoli]
MNRTIIASAAAAAAALLPAVLVAAPGQAVQGQAVQGQAVQGQAAQATGSSADQVAARAQAKPKKQAKVRVSIDQDVAVVGEDTLWFNGTVRPKIKGQTVVLQQRLEGKTRWSKSSSAKVRKNGRFVLSDEPSARGTRYYRIMKRPGKGVKRGFSEEMKVVVYRWDALTPRSHGPKLNVDPGIVQIGAQTYGNSLVTKAPGEGMIEYTLGSKCTKLSATYALTDTSATGSTGTAKLEADGVTKTWHELAIGTIAPVVSDVTGAFRVALRFTASETPAAQVAAADVKVLCTK